MCISKKRVKELEKRVADLELKVRIQQRNITLFREAFSTWKKNDFVSSFSEKR